MTFGDHLADPVAADQKEKNSRSLGSLEVLVLFKGLLPVTAK